MPVIVLVDAIKNANPLHPRTTVYTYLAYAISSEGNYADQRFRNLQARNIK